MEITQGNEVFDNCFSKAVSYESTRTYIKQAYRDPDYKIKLEFNIPKLIMPYYVSLYYVKHLTDCHFSSGYGGVPLDYTKLREDAEAKNSAMLRGKLAKQNPFNMGVALAEIKETVGLIGSTAVRLSLAYRHLRFGDVRKAFQALGMADNVRVPPGVRGLRGVRTARQHRAVLRRNYRKPKTDPSKFAAQTMLEISYGWTPLLLDVYGAAEYAANLLHKTDTDLTIASHAELPLGPSSLKSMNSLVHANVSGEFSVKYLYHLKVNSPTLRNLASLGLTNPMLIAWELVPFSFVYDWFQPVGSYLASLSAFEGYSIVQGCRSEKVAYNATMSSDEHPKYKSIQASSDSITHERYERTLSTSPPSARFPEFNFREALDFKRFAVSLSLLKVVFGK